MLIGSINIDLGGTMPETGNNPMGKSNARGILDDGYLPEYSITPEYTITTIFSSSEFSSSERMPVHDLQEISSRARIPVPEQDHTPCEKGDVISPGSLELIPDSNPNDALCMPLSPAQTPAESKGVFQRLLEPVRQRTLSPVLAGPKEQNQIDVREAVRRKFSEQMELPRGKFRALKRNTGLLFLIRDMKDERFTGYCRIQHEETAMLLVFGEGEILLASYNDLAGDPALDEILDNQYIWVDAMLHDLDEAQLQLALEFNESWKITRGNGDSFSDQTAMPGMMIAPDMKRDNGENNPSLAIEENLSAPALTAPVKDQSVIDLPNKPLSSMIHDHTAEPETAPDPEDDGWKRALTMSIRPDSTNPEVPALNFEPLSSDSALFERKAIDLRQARTAAPELNEKWHSMSNNRHQNNSI